MGRIYSHSSLSCFENCPRQFYHRYIARSKPMAGADTIEAFRGTIVHATLEQLYRHVMNGKVVPADALIADYRARWKSAYHDDISIPRQDYTAEEYRAAGEQWLTWYYDRHHPFNRAVVLDVEKEFRFALDKDERYRMRGFADRLDRVADGMFEVHDYKTNRELPTQEKLDKDRQLALYEIALRRQWKEVQRVELKWHFLQKDATLTSARTADQLAELTDRTITTISHIEGRDKSESVFEPTESGLCGWCEYQHLCPVRKHLYATQQLPKNQFLEEPGVQLVDRYAAGKERLGELKKQMTAVESEQDEIAQALIRYAETNSVTQINGSTAVATIRTETKLSLPTKTNNPEAYAEMEARLRASPAWPQVSILDRHTLLHIGKGEEGDRGEVGVWLQSFVQEQRVIKVNVGPIYSSRRL